MKIGKLSSYEVEQKRTVLGNFVIDGLGKEIYQLPWGALTGKGGWELFNKAIKENLQEGRRKITDQS